MFIVQIISGRRSRRSVRRISTLLSQRRRQLSFGCVKLLENIKRNFPNFLCNGWRFASIQLQCHRKRLNGPAFF